MVPNRLVFFVIAVCVLVVIAVGLHNVYTTVKFMGWAADAALDAVEGRDGD